MKKLAKINDFASKMKQKESEKSYKNTWFCLKNKANKMKNHAKIRDFASKMKQKC